MAAWPIVPGAGVAWRSWDFIKQFYFAVRERYSAANMLTWPRSAWVYDMGDITAITSTSVTIGGKAWSTAPPRWVGYDNTTGAGWEAADYDLIIDDCDPRKVIRSAITAQPSADTLTIDDITQRVTERVTPSIAALVGSRGVIIKRGGIWWSDRWIEWPNDEIYTDGLAKTAAAGTIGSGRALRHRAGLVGKDILFFNTLGALQRGRITSLAADVLTFMGTTGTAAIGGYFAVVIADGYYQAERVPPSLYVGRPKSFYRGAMDAYYSHWPNDVLTATPKPAVTRSFEYGITSCPGFSTAYPVQDVDLWVPQDNICGPGDFTFSPDLYKTLRGLWDACFDIADRFVDRYIDFDHAKSIPMLCAATWLQSAGINSQAATAGTHSGTGLPVTLTTPYVPIDDVWFAVMGDDDAPLTCAKGTYDGTEILGTFTADHDGKTVVVSLGPTRWVPRTFRRRRSATTLIPSVNVGVVWPPTELFPGHYETLAASTHYLEADAIGVMVEATRAEDAFADGDLARYVGDNWDDPTTQDSVAGGIDDLTPYWDRLFNGRRSRTIQARIDSSRSGYALAGSTTQLTSAFDWWGIDFWIPGAVFVRTGTATSGSTITLADTTQGGSAFWDDILRNQTGMTVTVTNPADATLHNRLITAHAGTTITFAPALPFAVAAGTVWTIRETDGIINRWKGLALTLTKPDPATPGAYLTATATISGNDDNTLFFPAIAWAVDDTTRFSIEAEGFGGVFLRAGGAWTVPTGNDPRAPNPPFRKSQTNNLPTMVKRYGLPNLRDYVVLANFTELQSGISALKKTRHGVAWTARADPAVADTDGNRRTASDSNIGSLGDDKVFEEGLYSGPHPLPAPPYDPRFENFGPPFAHVEEYVVDATHGGVLADREYAYMTGSFPHGLCGAASCAVEWFVYSEIDGVPHAAGFDGAVTTYFFDANGDPVAYRLWTRATTTAASGVLDRQTLAIGSTAHPNWTADPPAGETYVSGYYVTNQIAIAIWSFIYD